MKSLEENQFNEKQSTGGDSDTEMLNLKKELFSLTHYADDVEELVSQMFSSIKGPKLQAMLPPILKEIPLIDVQQLCLHELRGMSSRRILSIVNGVEMSDSSSEDDDLVDLNLTKCEADEKNSKEYNFESMDMESLKDLSLVDDPLLTALDVRQLEMRAKLIKNMLEKQPGEDSGEEEKGEINLLDPNIKIKEEPISSDEEADGKVKRSRRRRSSSSGSSRSSSSNSSSSSYSSYSSRSTHSSDSDKLSQKSNQGDSPNTKKHKKKISKKEFEARMKKARMNRSYRKRKESDDDSANESRRRHRRKRKLEKDKKEPTPELKETPNAKENGMLEEDEEDMLEKAIEVEKQKEITEDGKEDLVVSDVTAEKQIEETPEEEVLEKEEGEIDSNEENYYSDSRSSSYSSRSYSSSPKRHRRHKKRSRRRKTRTPPIPKVPNWEAGSKSALPKKSGKTVEENKTQPLVPLTEDRQSVSFTLTKKGGGGGSVVAPDSTPQDDSNIKKFVIENISSSGASSSVKNKDADDVSLLPEPKEIPQKTDETSAEGTEMVYKISCSEDEDGALPENSDADLQDDSVIDPIQNMDVDDGSAQLEEDSPDASEAPEEITTSEVLAEETSQDVLEPGEEDDGVEEQETTEIIGVIDPMDDNASSAFTDASNSSWSTRWLQSEKVQQVVSDSKMLSKMRKNIQAKGKTKVRKAPSAPVLTTLTDNKMKVSKLDLKSNKRAVGGIGNNTEDYENMFGIKVKVPQSLPAPKAQKPVAVVAAVETQSKAKSLASTLLDSDDDDDSEDDELWSKILKK